MIFPPSPSPQLAAANLRLAAVDPAVHVVGLGQALSI
jgi:hypothetical protein